jgi:hypothetical protein
MMSHQGCYHTNKLMHRQKYLLFLEIQGSYLTASENWTAIHSILETALLYPLVAHQYMSDQIETVDKLMNVAKCHALNLSCKFLGAVLHRPTILTKILLFHVKTIPSHQHSSPNHKSITSNNHTQTPLNSQLLLFTLNITPLQMA